MDSRKALQPGTKLCFPAMECTIEEEFGRGSNAIVYKGWYSDLFSNGEQHSILIKELFPWHPKGLIYRDSANDIVCTEDGQNFMTGHEESFEYGNRIHLRLLEKHPDQTGTNLNTFSLHNTFYTVMGFTGGRSLEYEYSGPVKDLRLLAVRILGILETLGDFHKEGYLHLDIAPDNILIVGKGARERVMLIDYNSVLPIDPERRGNTMPLGMKTGYASPEIRTGNREGIGPASDLYSVTAVFFRYLTGNILSPSQMIRKSPPDISNCVSLKNAPDTVLAMVREILGRGLHVLPGKRYRDTEEMMEAVRELIDRVDGVGITHWALWEAGRKKVNQTIRDNPSYAYMEDERMLFPSTVIYEDKIMVSAQEYFAGMCSPDGSSRILTAGAGMGKTTFLLRMVLLGQKNYSPEQSAAIYLSLSGNRGRGILDMILEILRFDQHTITYDNARHALVQLLDTPLKTPEGMVPVLMLLLDGWNEIPERKEELAREIQELDRLKGLRILIASRHEEPSFAFAHMKLAELGDLEVQKELSSHGLLVPESRDVQKLLRTPLLLSIFIRSSLEQGQQMDVKNQEELLDMYFHAILHKEIRALPDGSGQKWAIEAAMRLVLPAAAEEMEKKHRGLSDGEMLKVIRGCYRQISGNMLSRHFPEWTGRSREIRSGCNTPDEWFGLMIHDILWKRMGLLIRSQSGEYQMQHQVIREYFAAMYQRSLNRKKQGKMIGTMICMAGIVALLVLGIIAISGLPRQQSENPLPSEQDFQEAPPIQETDADLKEKNINIDGASLHFREDKGWEIIGTLPEGVTFENGEICLNHAHLHRGINAEADTVTIRLTGENTLEGAMWFSKCPVFCGEGSLTVQRGETEGLFCAEGPMVIEDCQLDIITGTDFGIMIGVREDNVDAEPDLIVRNAELNVSTEAVCLYAGSILIEDSEVTLQSSSENDGFSGYNGQEAAEKPLFVLRNSLLNLSHEYDGHVYCSFCGSNSQVILENSQIISKGPFLAHDLSADHCSFRMEAGDLEGSNTMNIYDGLFKECEIYMRNEAGSGLCADNALEMESCTLDIETFSEAMIAGSGDMVFSQCQFSVNSSNNHAILAGGNNRILCTDCTGKIRGITGVNGTHNAYVVFSGGDLEIEGTVAAVLCALLNPEENMAGIMLNQGKEESDISVSSLIWDGMVYYTFGENIQYDGQKWMNTATDIHLCSQ